MTKKEDLRIIKTKEALTNAFYDILSDTGFDDITVNMLCDRASIRRATFYKHFNDKNDFLAFLIHDVREQFEKTFTADGEKAPAYTVVYYKDYATALLKYFFEHNTAMAKILESSMRATVIDIFTAQNYIDTQKKLEASVNDGMHLPASVNVMAAMLIGGVSECIVRWFESEDRIPMDKLVDEVSTIIEKILK